MERRTTTKLCECGCGKPLLSTRKGAKFINGHQFKRFRKEPQYKIAKNGCWVFQLHINADGYGRFDIDGKRGVLAHRYYYELAKGKIPKGLVLDHLCRNKKCVNPDHLEVVTLAENSKRGGDGYV